MYSSLGEFIPFDKMIDPIHIKTEEEIEDEWINKERDIMRENWYDYEQEIKQIVVKPTQVWNVENWLKEVEDQMK